MALEKSLCKISFCIGLLILLASGIFMISTGKFSLEEAESFIVINYKLFFLTFVAMACLSTRNKSLTIIGANMVLVLLFVEVFAHPFLEDSKIFPIQLTVFSLFYLYIPVSETAFIILLQLVTLLFELVIYFAFIKINNRLREEHL